MVAATSRARLIVAESAQSGARMAVARASTTIAWATTLFVVEWMAQVKAGMGAWTSRSFIFFHPG